MDQLTIIAACILGGSVLSIASLVAYYLGVRKGAREVADVAMDEIEKIPGRVDDELFARRIARELRKGPPS